MPGLFKKAPAGKQGANKKSDSPIFVAADLNDADGKVIATREQVAAAISGYAQGKELEKQGQALMETHKTTLAEFARRKFAALWASVGTRPRSPKLTTKDDGTGTTITMSFIDRSSLMTDEQYGDLERCIGAANAKEAIERYTQYSIDAQLASQEVTINGDKATVQDHIEKALLAYFPEDKHELLGQMLKPKEIFQTKKGLLDRLLDFCGRGSPTAGLKVADAMVKARIITAYKPGAVGDDD